MLRRDRWASVKTYGAQQGRDNVKKRKARRKKTERLGLPRASRIVVMPTCIYETTDPAKPVRTFEVKQSVRDGRFAATRKLAKERGV